MKKLIMKKSFKVFCGMDAVVTNQKGILQSKIRGIKSARMRILYTIAIAVVIAFSMVSCGFGGGGSFKLTGIPSSNNGKYAYLIGQSQTGTMLLGYQKRNMKGFILPKIQDGSVTIPVWKMGFTRYSGNEKIHINIIITDKETLEAINGVQNALGGEFTFVNGSAEKKWSEIWRAY